MRFPRRNSTIPILLIAVACALLSGPGPARAQAPVIDLARQAVVQIPAGYSSLNIAIYGVTLGMPWGEARNVLDRQSIPYIFQKGTSPVVYVPPQRSTYYFILNPSSYDVIEMGIINSADLPLDNQYLFDGQRWRLTTARTQFFGNEGEFITNEEGESYNFPYLGFVLKYLTPGSFRFVMVAPTNKPITTLGTQQRPGIPAAKPEAPPPAPQPVPQVNPEDLGRWLQDFERARQLFEEKRYGTALAEFKAIVEGVPDALTRVRAVYWMGECFYGLRKYRNARQQFERVLQETDIEALREPAQKMIQNCNKKIR